MPTYEYKCKDKQHLYTEIRGISDSQSRDTCPEPNCGSPLMRIFAAPPITFKGSGFSKNNG